MSYGQVLFIRFKTGLLLTSIYVFAFNGLYKLYLMVFVGYSHYLLLEALLMYAGVRLVDLWVEASREAMSLLDEKYPMSKVNNSQEEQNK
jgi:hypothetical protein